MLLSSESNLFRKGDGNVICQDVYFGKAVLIAMECGKIVVTLPNVAREYATNPATPLYFSDCDDCIVRFSDKIHISLPNSKPSIDDLKTALGVNVDITKTYEILPTRINERLKRMIEKIYGEKEGFLYFNLRLCHAFQDSDEVINGHVFSITLRPTPLLSLSLSCQYMANSQSRHSDINPLLHQCVKRLLAGNIVVYNNKLCDYRSNISLSLPSTTSKLHFDIINAVSFSYNKLSAKEEVSSCVYLILPSTRITIENEDFRDTVSSQSTNITNMDNIVLEVIKNVRCCSLLNADGGDRRVDIPRAFLLLGPPGVGKTYQVRTAIDAMNNESPREATKLISIRGSEILSMSPNEADVALHLKKIFSCAVSFTDTRCENICLIFMDECDALLSSDIIGATFGFLLDCLSNNHENESVGWKRIIVVAATNRVDAIPSHLRRPGRFDREVVISPPSAKERLQILEALVAEMGLSHNNFNPMLSQDDLTKISEITVGFVAADLSSLMRRALFLGITESSNSESNLSLHHLEKAMQDVSASALRHTSSNAPPATTWDDISGDPGGAKVRLE